LPRAKACIALFPVALVAASGAAHPKLAKDFNGIPDGKLIDVIVKFKSTVSTAHHDKVKQKGGAWKRTLGLISAGQYAMTPASAALLAADNDVERIWPDRAIRSSLDLSRETAGAALAASYGYDGKGVGVAVIDSGISSPPDMSGRIAYKESFISLGTDEKYGHGTHVAGIIAGIGKDSSKKYLGIAPAASLIALRVLDDQGAGSDSAVIQAIDRAIALKAKFNIRVINLSLGRPVFESFTTDPLCLAVERAWKAGIVVVVAAGNLGRENRAGNDGYATIASPGNSPYVITVGAMKANSTAIRGDDTLASYSSKGPTAIDHIAKPDLVAPGNRVVSVSTKGVSNLEEMYGANRVGSAYFRLSGTSMAAPMVSGAAALLLQKWPDLTPDGVKARLMRTASKSFPSQSLSNDPVTGQSYVSRYDVFSVGAGYLDIGAALNDYTPVSGTARSPIAVYNPSTGQVSLVFPSGVTWGTGVSWGTGVVWGSAFVSSTGVCWGSGVVWGSGGNLAATGVVWGSGVIWGSGVAWGTNTPIATAVQVLVNGEN
jgi:serine protease AprX